MKPLLALAVLVLSALPALPAAAGPYDQPWSIVETYYNRPADSHLRKVIVSRVDDQNSIGNRVVTTPGHHTVVLDLPRRKGFHIATQERIDIDMKPCTRYYMAAELRSLTLQEWQPIVKYEEPIGECRKKFNLAENK